MPEFRIERDSMGEVQVPAAAYYGAQTQRAVELLEEARQITLRDHLPTELLVQLERDLAITWMVYGERQNCSAHHRAASCILAAERWLGLLFRPQRRRYNSLQPEARIFTSIWAWR